jgi:hypothetical protein
MRCMLSVALQRRVSSSSLRCAYLNVRCGDRPVIPSCVCPMRDTSNTEEHSSTAAAAT